MTKLTVEETNLLSIYKTGGKGLDRRMQRRAALHGRGNAGLCCRTLSKVEAMTEAEFAGLPIYAADEV